MSAARLIVDPPASGAWNMAVDEALLEWAVAGMTTLRFYQWSGATLSLGYFQSADARLQHVASRDCPLVRRASGGGAIVHDRELTYSFAAPIKERFGKDAAGLYDAFHASLIGALRGLGAPATTCQPVFQITAEPSRAEPPFLCFQRRTRGDVLLDGAKIAGSAQRRSRGGLLQHGSILLAASAAASELPGIENLTGLALSPSELVADWLPALEAALDLRFDCQELSLPETRRAAEIESGRFLSPAWTYRRETAPPPAAG